MFECLIQANGVIAIRKGLRDTNFSHFLRIWCALKLPEITLVFI